jgi:putative DNA primase/helicase
MHVFASTLYRKNTQQLIYFITGSGGNGKSIMVDFVKSTMGTYAGNLGLSYYTTPTINGSSPELVAISNARFIWTSETDAYGSQQSVFLDSPLKLLTGGEEIQCRAIRSNYMIKFVAGTPMVLTNTLPIFKGFDSSHKRRIKVIHLPWSYVETVDDHLSVANGGFQKKRDTKIQDLPHNLAYKCALFKILSNEFYLGNHTNIPMSSYLLNHTDEYFNSSDKLGGFLKKILIVDKEEKISNNEVWQYYCKYIKHISKDSFGKLLKKQNSNYPNKVVKINGKAAHGISGYKINKEAIEQLEMEAKENEIENQVNNQDILDI